MRLRDRVLATMKSRDTEGAFELYVTRTPGYLWALLFRRLGVHPIAVTLASIAIGAAAGYFFYFPSREINLIGMLLLVWANWYDCADGQLARMTGKKTLIGRILDGFAGDVWFFCIYLAIALRLTHAWTGLADFMQHDAWVWALMAWAGLHCHSRQCALADYYRNIHLWFLLGKQGSELDTSREEKREMESMRWLSRDWFHTLYLFFYIKSTRAQQKQTPCFQQLYRLLQEKPHLMTDEVRQEFRRESRPLMPLTNILTFDTRVGVLFLSLLLGQPWVWPLFECTVLEAIRFRMRNRHERLCRHMYQDLSLI